VGIGGDPVTLLARCAQLVRPGGIIVAELAPPGTPTESLHVRVEHEGDRGPWFPWARVGTDAWPALVIAAGLEPRRLGRAGARWFGTARRA